MRTPKHPKWVDKIFGEMTRAEKDYIVKTTLYMNMDCVEGGYKVSKILREQANRVDAVFDEGHSIWILSIAARWFSYCTMQRNKDPFEFIDE